MFQNFKGPRLKSVTDKIEEYRAPGMNRLDEAPSRMLGAMFNTGKHIYGGTVPTAEKQRRRAANKVARRSRALNRR